MFASIHVKEGTLLDIGALRFHGAIVAHFLPGPGRTHQLPTVSCWVLSRCFVCGVVGGFAGRRARSHFDKASL